MKTLIVGGLGYLGPVIVSQIRDLTNCEKIDVADLGWFLGSAVQPAIDRFDTYFQIDKRDITIELLGSYDVVIDLAAVSNDPMGKDFEQATIEINADAAISLAQMCRKAGVRRFIFASSCSIYGAAGVAPRNEDDAKGPLTAYAKSKWMAEQALKDIADETFGIVALRFGTACGWSPHFRADLVLNDFVLTAITAGSITVLSDGTPWRPLVHVKDIGRAVAWACQDNSAFFSYYNIGSNSWTLTIGDLASQVGRLTGVPVEIKDENGPDNRSYQVSFDKFEEAAKGWLPQIGLEEAVLEMQQEFTKSLDRFKDFRSGNLIRLNVLREIVSNGEMNAMLRTKEDQS